MQNGEMTSDVPHLIEMVEVEGVWFPTFFERDRPMKEQLERVRALELREDDVILCAYPKSGEYGGFRTFLCDLMSRFCVIVGLGINRNYISWILIIVL